MAIDKNSGKRRRFTIRLAGLQPGVRPEEFTVALKRLYRRRTLKEVRQLLNKLPVVLAKSVTEEQARKVYAFLKPKGAILKLSYAVPAPPAAVKPRKEEPSKVPKAAAPPKQAVSTTKIAPRIERRAKPRVHSGIQVHPMGVGEILDRSFGLLRQYFWLFFSIVFIPQGVYFLLNHGVGLISGISAGPQTITGEGMGFSVFAVPALLIFILLQFWAQGALIYAVSETYLGHSTSVGSSYSAIRKRLGPLLGTLILSGVLVFVLVLAGIISAVLVPILMAFGGAIAGVPGVIACVIIFCIAIFLLLNWLLVDKVVVLELKSWIGALRRSKELMSSRTEPGFWRRPKNKAGLILLIGILIVIGIHLFFLLPGVIFSFIVPGSLLVSTLMGLLKMISTSLATAFTATAMILFYYDIRLRKEGFDLKLIAQNL